VIGDRKEVRQFDPNPTGSCAQEGVGSGDGAGEDGRDGGL